MGKNGFSSGEIEHDWQALIKLGPRFPGTANEIATRNFLRNCLVETSSLIQEQEFHYQGWSLLEKPQLKIISPSAYDFPCEAMIHCRPTPLEGIRGTVRYIGRHIVMDAFTWEKFAVIDKDDKVLAYISGRPDGPAQPQPLNKASAAVPHFVIGTYELNLLSSWIDRRLKVEVKGKLNCSIHPNSTTKNIIASFNPKSTQRRLCLCAHYDSVYNSPGANDNAAAVSALLAIARKMTRESSSIPLDLLFLNCEEWDLLGSKAYVKDLITRNKLSTIKMAINLDSIAEGASLELWVGPESFEEQLKKAVDDFPRHPPGRRILTHYPPPYSSDHTPFYDSSIPACMLFCGETGKYHVPQDDYCPEGALNIIYITDLTWYLINQFASLDVPWSTWQNT